MRPVLVGDILAAARVLMALPRGARDGALAEMLAEADLADRFRRRTGRAHPRFGGGCLMAAALARRPGPEPFPADAAFLDALSRVGAALAERAEKRHSSL